jgi:hypothetical protein
MDEAFERRAARRRATWQGGVARSWDELDERGAEFWRSAPAGARLTAMWELLVDAWAIKGKHGPPPGFQGSIVGVGRFER